jgi:hypothetical protein
MELFSQFNAEMTANSPLWVGIWVNFMVAVLALAIPFSFAQKEARWILLGAVLGMAGTIIAYSQFGFTRILGVGHILFWSPTLVYMLGLRGRGVGRQTLFGKWLFAAILVMGISLAFDYVDLLRWLLGERDPIRM